MLPEYNDLSQPPSYDVNEDEYENLKSHGRRSIFRVCLFLFIFSVVVGGILIIKLLYKSKLKKYIKFNIFYVSE